MTIHISLYEIAPEISAMELNVDNISIISESLNDAIDDEILNEWGF